MCLPRGQGVGEWKRSGCVCSATRRGFCARSLGEDCLAGVVHTRGSRGSRGSPRGKRISAMISSHVDSAQKGSRGVERFEPAAHNTTPAHTRHRCATSRYTLLTWLRWYCAMLPVGCASPAADEPCTSHAAGAITCTASTTSPCRSRSCRWSGWCCCFCAALACPALRSGMRCSCARAICSLPPSLPPTTIHARTKHSSSLSRPSAASD